MAPRELSTRWWNVIRRQVRATKAVEHDVTCPDCGTPKASLIAGRFGRFYRCQRLDCFGGVSAKLDGTPRRQRGSPEEHEARRRARDAVGAVVRERERISEVVEAFVRGERDGHAVHRWWNLRACGASEDFQAIATLAELQPLERRKVRTDLLGDILLPHGGPVPLRVRRRSIVECERIVKACAERIVQMREDFATHPANGWWSHVARFAYDLAEADD
jgi:hypothetical protein